MHTNQTWLEIVAYLFLIDFCVSKLAIKTNAMIFHMMSSFWRYILLVAVLGILVKGLRPVVTDFLKWLLRVRSLNNK